MKQLTELEIKMLKDINRSYKEHRINNTEFWNIHGWYENDCMEKSLELRKQLRGTFASLKRKKIVSHYNEKGCFNPIFPTKLYVEIMKMLGEEVTDEVMEYIKL